MSASILTTKLHIPTLQPNTVLRPRLAERLNDGLHRKLTLVSAAAGFGKTTLVSEWVTSYGRPVAWLSLDEGDGDRARFLTHLVAALQTINENIGEGVLGALRSPQPPSNESILTSLLNEVAALQDHVILVLDDYQVLDSTTIDDALGFLLEHMPQHMHLVIATREDPHLPLARLRARGQLAEVRATDLRFTPAEAAEFLNQAMGLNLSEEDIATLDTRTEGWVAGLQLAAISMQGHDDTSGFIRSFSGSHRFVLDYLLEEVLQRQTEDIQAFLLNTSILDRMCGPLCDALLPNAAAPGRETLERLETANLFIIPLDNERAWYRYHHLFAELLRQRLRQKTGATPGGDDNVEAGLHIRASEWFEKEGLELEAFHHATAANDVERAERLANGTGAALYVRGGATPVLNWLESLPAATLDARPSLWVMLASILAVIGRLSRVEATLQAAESALQGSTTDDNIGALIARMHDLRTLLAVLVEDPIHVDAIIKRTRDTLQHLSPDDVIQRSATIWKLGLAYQHQGDRATAGEVFSETIAASEASGNTHVNILASTCLGRIREFENRLYEAAGIFHHTLHLVGEPPGPIACEAYVGLARIHYEWNDLELAQQHGELSLILAHQVELASFVSSELFLARMQLTNGDVPGAIASLARTEQQVREKNFLFRMPGIAALQVEAWLQQGNLAEAERLVEQYEIPLSRARVYLARSDAAAALATLESHRRNVEAKGWHAERLAAMLLQAIAHHANGDLEAALLVLADALAIAEPGGFIRTFVDEGKPMAGLLAEAAVRGIAPDYSRRLLAAFDAETPDAGLRPHQPASRPAQPLVEPLSARELEILALIAQGLSNNQISDRLFLALATVKGHNRNIFSKLQVQRRTEAVARARELGLL
jgi:LuxR family transcriptional regulator, maltose regulon positive regulatory protein